MDSKTFLTFDFHTVTANSKTFFNNKTDHLRHYEEKIVEKQNNIGLDIFDHKDEIKLVKPLELTSKFSDVLNERKTSRSFNKYKIKLDEISTLLNYSSGFNRDRFQKKYTPSSGGFNSVETFVIILNSDEVEPGMYYFDSKKYSLRKIAKGNFDQWLKNHVFFQKEYGDASMVVILASNVARLMGKYSQRSYRLGLLDVGHVSQNFYLTAAALNLNICASAGYIESEIEEALNINSLETPTFLTLSIGL